ncbi:hypothetical protein ACFOTA_07420 [Chitinophaga sp. GCM10012297]|uniref:Uncharacterized protein n=1 Tax=Chitinophaga chungangae TaxID=2821488 RepID=A0ABS3YBH0_9BACT|nr:hypothetical protein [Chitinophaga chungangae]MBO9152030.1 hypothetical protein [Chitinophaga chungangae]
MKSTKTSQQPQQEDDLNIRKEGEQENEGAFNENAPVEDDGSPVLDEEDLEENSLSEEEADNIEREGGQPRESQG